MHIAIVTARSAVGTDKDELALLAALSAVGADTQIVLWDDPAVDWGAYDLAVVRSTWDYSWRREEFLAWARTIADRTRLCNRPDVLEWNSDKTYLRELAAAGVPVVPTTFLTPGGNVRLPPGEGQLVVKPSVSAGSRKTARYTTSETDAAREHAEQLLKAGNTVLVQPYQHSVDTRGETALVFVHGRFSHAANAAALLTVGKPPTSKKLVATKKLSAAVPTAAERDVAEAALDATPFTRAEFLYARVDLLDGPDGTPLLLELELVEPSMFLRCAPPQAVSMFATAIIAAATQRDS